MDRKISLSDFRNAMYEAYDQFKDLDEGSKDPRLADVESDKFGISLALADGTVINKGDTDFAAVMGGLVKIPLMSLLLEQAGDVKNLIKKSGNCPMTTKAAKPKDVKGAKGIRAMSALQPVGDPDSKWNFLENRMISLMGSAPELDTALYETLKSSVNDEVNALADADFYLYDDAASSIDLYRRAESMMATTEQLAVMGATIAADGVNPLTRKVVYDGKYSQNIVGMMAAHGPHKMALPWNLAAGVPALSSFGGTVLAVYPGAFAIAAYSPLLTSEKVSVRAFKAIMTIMRKLDVSAFASAKLIIDKER